MLVYPDLRPQVVLPTWRNRTTWGRMFVYPGLRPQVVRLTWRLLVSAGLECQLVLRKNVMLPLQGEVTGEELAR